MLSSHLLKRSAIGHLHRQGAARCGATLVDASSSSSSSTSELHHPQRVWKSSSKDEDAASTSFGSQVWTDRVADRVESFSHILENIEAQEMKGGRLRSSQYGVLHEDPATDMELLTKNYTVSAVASALRDREDALQQAAILAQEARWSELQNFLSIFHPKFVLERRSRHRQINFSSPFDQQALELIRRALMRRPRTVTQAHSRRAAVVIPLCTVDGVPSILLEKRSHDIRAHPDEVCLPGGMVCDESDNTIVETSVREMREEIGGLPDPVVLGILRCNWGEVHHLVGVAVTPVVCYLGELPDELSPNADEVAEIFTIPVASLLDKHLWVYKENLAPIFLGGPHVIWGLTGYILDRFYRDILLPYSRQQSDDL